MSIEQALALQNQGKIEEARLLFNSMLQTDPTHQLLYHFGMLELQIGQIENALQLFDGAIQLNPSHAPYWVILGKLMVQLGETQLADQSFTQACNLEPTAQNFFLLGRIKLQLNQPLVTINYWTAALKKDPHHLETLLFLGDLYNKRSESEKALPLFKKAHTLAPEDSRTIDLLIQWYSQKAEALLEQNTLKALELIDQALEYAEIAHLLHQKAEIQHLLGRMIPAELSCLQAISKDPQASYFYTLGNIYRTSRQKKKALQAYLMAEQKGLQHPAMTQAIKILKGEGTTLDTDVVELMFDQYAERFDKHLTHLGYYIPKKMAAFLQEQLPERSFSSVLDIGCGTGMSVEPFLPITQNRVGIDISEKMLQKAEKKNIYQHLHQGDATKWLQTRSDSFELILCLDTLMYIGEAEPLFSAVHQATSPKGLFLVSTEKLEKENGFTLQSSERFAHSDQYIEALCKDRFRVIAKKEEGIRKEMDSWIPGTIWILERLD